MELTIEEIDDEPKTYYQKHRLDILKKKKDYYLANREKLLEKCNTYARELIQCPHCELQFTRCRLSTHLKKVQHKEPDSHIDNS